MTKSQRKTAAATRAREYRERQREAARPAARTVDQALSEALSFVIAQAGALHKKPGEGSIDVFAIVKTATAVLKREGYSKAESAKAVMSRVKARPEHGQADYIPSLKPTADPSARIPDRISPRGPRPDCRPPAALAPSFNVDAYFDDIAATAE